MTSTVTVTLSNTSTGSAANVTSLTDDVATMGGKAIIASPSAIATTCTGGTASIAGTVVSLAGGVIPAGVDSTHPGTCTVSFNVIGAVLGNGVNSIAVGALVTDQGTNATAASQTLQVIGSPLTVAGSVTPTSQLSSTTATQTFTITNPNASAITNATFPITLTNGGANPVTQFTLASGSTGGCGGTVSPSSFTSTNANPSLGTATVSGITIPANNGSCTITLNFTDPVAATAVSVTSTLAAGAVSSDQGVTSSAPAVVIQSKFFSGLATISKGFAPSIVLQGLTSRMTVTIRNTQLVPLTNVAFSDVMPTFMTLDANPAPTYSNCGTPTLTGAGTATLGISGATVLASSTLGTAGTSCSIVVTVDTANNAFGSLLNTLPAANLTDTQNVAGQSNATATLAISAGALNVSKSFSGNSPVSNVRNTPVTETISFSNGGGTPLTAGSFTDNLPQSPVTMQYYPGFTPTFTNCGTASPTLTVTGSNTIVSTTSGNLVIAASSSCVVKFQVILLTGGYPQQTATNTIPTANVSFTDSNSNIIHPTAAATATILTLPSFTVKNYITNSGGVANQPVTVQGQILYSGATAGLVTDTNVSATFVLNSSGHNVKLAPSPNYQFSGCPNGTSAGNITAGGNGESFVVALTTLSATCTISYDVVNENTITPPSVGYTQGTSSYTSTENGGTSTTTGNGTVTFYTTSLLLNKVFTPNSIASGGTATATLTLDVAAVAQLGSTQANGVTFVDSLPANTSFAAAPNVILSAGCTQSGQLPATGTPAGTTITFANISLLSGTDCVVKFDVTSNFLGNTTNTIPTGVGGLTSTSGATNSQSASASLTVVAGVALQKTFLNSTFAIGDVNYVRFVVVNSSGGALSSGTVTDVMPASLALASLTAQPTAQSGDPTACGGSVSGTVGSSTFSLSGMSVAGAVSSSSPGECVRYVQVKASTTAAPGAVVNSVPAGALIIGGQSNLTIVNSPPMTVAAAPNAAVTQAFAPLSVQQHTPSTLTITIANTGTLAAALTAAALTDALPANLVVAATPNAATSCSGATVTAVAGASSVALAGGSIGANASCTITVDVTSSIAASYTNTLAAGTLTTTQGATNALSTAPLTVTAAPNVTLGAAFAPLSIIPNASSTLTLTIANTAGSASALTSLALTDTLPSGLQISATPGASTTCGAGSLTATVGTASVALTGGTLASGATCTVTVNVTGSTIAGYTDTIAAGALTSYQGATNAAASAPLSIVAANALTLSLGFAPASIAVNGTSVLTMTLANTSVGSSALTNLTLADALPTGITIAAVPNAATTCGGSLTAVASSSNVALSGSALAAGATCTVSVTVTGSAAGPYLDTIAAGSATSTEGATNPTATATLTINAPSLTVATAFTPSSVQSGAASTLSITIVNAGTGAITLAGLALTDTLPTGIVVAATPNAVTTCVSGTVTAAAGASSVALASGSLAPSGTCTIHVDVTGTIPAVYTNTIATNAVSTTQGVSNAAAATANLTINAAATTLTTTFLPASIGAGSTSLLTITIPNTAVGAVTLSNMALTDTLPSGITIAATPGAATTCGGGAVTATAGGTSVALTSGTLAVNGSCTVTVNVTGTLAAVYTNTIAASALTTAEGVSNPASASASLTITLNGTTLTQAFSPTTILAGGTSILTITIPNTAAGAVTLTGMALSDVLPSGLTIASTPNAATTCGGGTVTAIAGGTSAVLASGSVGATATCAITVSVTGTAASTYTNTIAANALTTNQGVSNPSVSPAALTITLSGATLSQAFSPTTILAGATSRLTITIPNSAPGAVMLSAMTLSDTLPAGLTVAATPNAATTCGPGTVSAVAGGTTFALAAGTLAAGGTCVMRVDVTGTTANPYVNTIPANALVTAQSVSNATLSTANLTIDPAATTLTTAFVPASINAGAVSVLTITIPNTAVGAVTLTGMSLTDLFPSGLTIAATPDAATTCGAGTLTAAAGSTSIALAGGTLPAGSTCTISVNVTAIIAATYTNTIAANALTTGQSVSNASPATADLTVTLRSARLSQAFAPAAIVAGATSALTITIINTAVGAVQLTGISLGDTLPTGLTIASAPNAVTTCQGGSIIAPAGGTSVALAGGMLAAAGSCTITVNVTGTAALVYTNTILASALTTTQGVTNTASAIATLTIGAVAPSVTLAQAYVSPAIATGGVSTLTITISNAASGAAALSAIALADVMPSGTAVAPTPNAATTCGGTLTSAAGATQISLSGGALAPNASCTLNVNVTGPAAGTYVNLIPAGALSSAQGASNAQAAQATLTIAAGSLQVVKTSNAPSGGVAPGGTIVYSIVLTNTSVIAETHPTLTDTLTNATLVPGSVTVDGTAAADSIVTHAAPLSTLAPGAHTTVGYTALVAAAATPGLSVTNGAAAGGDQPCTGSGCSTSAAPVAVVAPTLGVTITIDGMQSETVVAGQVVTYAITVTNTSAVTATGIQLVDTVPAGATPIAGTATLSSALRANVPRALSSGTINGQVLTVLIDSMAPGAATVIAFNATMSIAGNTQIVNMASVSASGMPAEVISNTVVALAVHGTLRITKTASAALVTVGDRVNYTIAIGAPAGIALGATSIVDTLPQFEAYAPGTTRIGGLAFEPVIAGRTLTWTLPAITNLVTITYATAITAGAQPNTTLTNLVSGSGVSPGGAPPSTGTASAAVQVASSAFGSCYPITGRVFLDDGGNRGVAQVRLYLDDGESVLTDESGRYDFPCVRPGMHAIRLDASTLTGGITAYDDRRLDSIRSTRRLIHSTLDATILQDVNFALRAAPRPGQ